MLRFNCIARDANLALPVFEKIVIEFNESLKFNGDLPKFCQLINRLIKFVSIFI